MRVREKLSSHVGEFMAALLIVQPLLDVLSYFAQGGPGNAFTTALRMVMLAAVCLYALVITDRRQLYLALYGGVAAFWFLHVLNCIRVGYRDPVGDAAMYLRLVQFPLWTASFYTFFRKREGLDLRMVGVLALNFAIILLVIGLSYVTGTPVYTYDNDQRGIHIGVMGWFAVHSAQSAIVSLLALALLLWGYRAGKLWAFCLCCVGGLGLLCLTGTRMAYYTALIAAGGFLVLILLTKKRLSLCIPLMVSLVLILALKGVMPMSQRQALSADSVSLYQERIDQVMGEDAGYVRRPGEEIPPEVLEKIRAVYTDVYGVDGVFDEPLLGDLNQRFGVDRVMELYDYTLRPQDLNDARVRKVNALRLVWDEQDALTHFLGFEYSNVWIGNNIYDPENDFPALLFYTGYLGTALYAGFLIWVVACGAVGFFKKFPALLTVEFGTAVMMFVLTLGAAQLSGNVLRRPNVTVYSALAAAAICYQARKALPADRLPPGHKRNPAVSLKKL